MNRIRHDLGKYVSLQLRALPPDPSEDELRAALEADLLGTRRGPQGADDAVTVWAEVRPVGGIEAIDAAMEVVARTIALLRAGGGTITELRVGAEAALAVTRLTGTGRGDG